MVVTQVLGLDEGFEMKSMTAQADCHPYTVGNIECPYLYQSRFKISCKATGSSKPDLANPGLKRILTWVL